MNSEIEKIDVEELIKGYRVPNVDQFTSYLKEIWRYYVLPGIISERLFTVFDTDNNNYLDLFEFIEGMKALFYENYDKLMQFIFKFYDFDKNMYISKEDVRTVLSYVPLNTNAKLNKLTFEKDTFKDRVESQEELHSMLEKVFANGEFLDFKGFQNSVENISSDMFLFILIFLFEQRPFSKKTLQTHEKSKSPIQSSTNKFSKSPILTTKNKLIASPNMMSKFSPTIALSRSPTMLKKALDTNPKHNQLLRNLAGVQDKDSKNVLKNYSVKSGQSDQIEEGVVAQIPVYRKDRNNLSNINTNDSSKVSYNSNSGNKNDYTDLNILPAHKYKTEGVSRMSNDNLTKITKDLNSLKIENDSDEEDENNFQGYLLKITQTKKLKKLWFKLVHKDLYYYRTSEDTTHKGMHNLSGVHLQEEKPLNFDGKTLLAFSVIYPKKSRFYYTDNEADYKNWVFHIRKATGYANLNDIYDIKEKLGNGKFGLVRMGIHKTNYRRVAVKIMSKKDMTTQDFELVRTEIEILKVCQHPNIIRLYDVFENIEHMYIIMEYCSGGDLFNYIEKRGFKLHENRAAQLIHKLSTAVFYLHSYGIAHRDLKPENILMTDGTDEADMRLLDFGLSKIIGPNETCTEPFGTLSYVAPEVLLEKPYTKAVDLWSIGIITYLLLCGCLPFDHETSEREIAKQTISNPTPFPSSLWKKSSSEAKAFVDNLLNKNPEKRMSIKEVLEHPWIQKYNKTKLPEIRRQSKDLTGSTFVIYSTTEEQKGKTSK